MATAVLAPTPAFPVGTSVEAYPRSNWLAAVQDTPTAPPPGSADATATTAADGTTTFTGLTTGTRYWAYASVSGQDRFVSFSVPVAATTGATTADVQAVRDRLPGVLDADGGLKVHLQNAAAPASDVSDRAGRLLGHVDVDTLPGTPSQEHTTAGSPESARLSDGSAFYKATTPADTQPVSGPVTDAQLRATAVPVSGTFWQATQPVSGTVTVAEPVSVDDNAGSLTVDSADLGTVAEAESSSGSGSVVALLKRLRTLISGGLPAALSGSGNLKTAVSEALPAGTNNIGDVDLASAIPAGNNNIGDVDVASLPALPAGTNNIGDVDLASAIPAGNNNIGDVDVASLPALPAGTNNIGDVDILTLPAIPAGNNNIGDVDVATQPARAATTDAITAKIATDTLQNGLTALTPKFAIIDAASSGNNTLVAAVASKKLRVVAAFLVSAGTVNARLESGADGTALTGQMNLVANVGFVLPFNPVGWFETGSNVLLNLELSAAISVDGSLVYVEV